MGEPSSPYGLTARQLDAAASFDLDDGFVEASAAEQLDVVVIYQPATGALEPRVDDGGSMVALTESNHEDALGWRTASYRIAAPAFADGPDGRTDLELVPSDGAPVVHRIEVLRTGEPSTGGGSGSGGGGTGGLGAGGNPGGATAQGADGDDGGCGCVVAGEPTSGTERLIWPWLTLILIGRRRQSRP